MTSDPHPPNRSSDRASIPWLWLGAGLLVTLVGLSALAWALGDFLVTRPEEAGALPEPTIVRLTAPPLPTATIVTNPATPTVAPTATTAATPDLSVAPPEVTAGYYAQVVETGGVGVTVRNGPNTSNTPVAVAAEGSFVLVLEGPTPGGAYQWWRLRLPDGTEGWAAGDFLVPAAAP
jgi:hypothetical protein